MKALLVTCFVAGCLFLGGFSSADVQADDSGLKKITPFGKKKESGGASADEQEEDPPGIPVREIFRPLTPAGVKGNIQRIGKSTRSAWSRTRQALTPQHVVPRWQLLRRQTRPATEASATASRRREKADKQQQEVSLSSWLFSPNSEE
ncbi:MAG: hypothetical protein GTO53_13650 [Planctomycetales bacterium]|nr:hypothetical protein [Planctomycetales bacterium]NIM10135.1 hypothetical protein [Planctomycetales bacterium]NIN08377.1 hypothetical protein [Planctomycetales bacterium]NIN77505.1 hypothetical protein [Planctomycetales bacterium]NIO34677.1 hypothetical protein [Planctomycetales bacterium]